jgi:hypothetical protein
MTCHFRRFVLFPYRGAITGSTAEAAALATILLSCEGEQLLAKIGAALRALSFDTGVYSEGRKFLLGEENLQCLRSHPLAPTARRKSRSKMGSPVLPAVSK